MRIVRLLAVLLLLRAPAAALAQVGHDPAGSPYGELRFGQFFGATAGYFAGDGGSFRLAPHGGALAGLRYDFLAAGTITLGLAASRGTLERDVIDPTASVATRVSGPVDQSATFLEGIIQFNVTGGKTWRRLGPFVSGAFGLVLAGKVPQDSSGFSFRTRGAITPGIGTRIFLSQRLFLRLEARATFWQVTYPRSFTEDPADAPNDPPVLENRSPKEWIVTPWYSVGLSYAFYRPF
ncbi:MAG: hypothetical protein ACRENB_07855 [Gemmatimonadales bacterium]